MLIRYRLYIAFLIFFFWLPTSAETCAGVWNTKPISDSSKLSTEFKRFFSNEVALLKLNLGEFMPDILRNPETLLERVKQKEYKVEERFYEGGTMGPGKSNLRRGKPRGLLTAEEFDSVVNYIDWLTEVINQTLPRNEPHVFPGRAFLYVTGQNMIMMAESFFLPLNGT